MYEIMINKQYIVPALFSPIQFLGKHSREETISITSFPDLIQGVKY